MIELILAIVAVLLFAIAFALGYLVHIDRATFSRLEQRVKELEDTNSHKRLRHDTIAGLEDGVAILVGELIEEDLRSTHRQQRLQQLKSVLAEVRNMTYSTDRPCESHYKRESGNGGKND
jgi:hypothetical protein